MAVYKVTDKNSLYALKNSASLNLDMEVVQRGKPQQQLVMTLKSEAALYEAKDHYLGKVPAVYSNNFWIYDFQEIIHYPWLSQQGLLLVTHEEEHFPSSRPADYLVTEKFILETVWRLRFAPKRFVRFLEDPYFTCWPVRLSDGHADHWNKQLLKTAA